MLKSMLYKTKNYRKSATQLPKNIKLFLSKQERFLSKDIFYPKLHTKKLQGFDPDLVYSFRITREYRALFRIQDSDIILFAIGHRKEVYFD